jgi:hypothetical protein
MASAMRSQNGDARRVYFGAANRKIRYNSSGRDVRCCVGRAWSASDDVVGESMGVRV